MTRFEIVKDSARKHSDSAEILLPERASARSAGYDFYSPEDITLNPGAGITVWTDLKAHLEKDYVLLLFPRSSIGRKGIMLMNTVGVIDADYYSNEDNDGNIGIMLYNYGNDVFELKSGARFAQGVILKYKTTDSDRAASRKRTGGFGSTGK